MKENYGKIVRNLLIATLTIWGVTFAAARRDIYTDLLRHTNWAFTLNKSNLFEFMTTYISPTTAKNCGRSWGFYKILLPDKHRIRCVRVYVTDINTSIVFSLISPGFSNFDCAVFHI